MPDVFTQSTVEQLIGGNAGIIGFDYCSGWVEGKMATKADEEGKDFTAVHRALVKTLIKGIGGAAVMTFSPTISNGNSDIANIALGAGAGPLMTLGNDWYKAIREAYPEDDGEDSARRSRRSSAPPTQSRRISTIRNSAKSIRTPMSPGPVNTKLQLEV